MPESVSQCGPLALAGMAARRPDERVAISGITTAHQRSRMRLRLSMYRHPLGRPEAVVWGRVRSVTYARSRASAVAHLAHRSHLRYGKTKVTAVRARITAGQRRFLTSLTRKRTQS